MVWIVLTLNGFGPLIQLNRSLTVNDYVQLLGEILQSFMAFMYPKHDEIFMDNNVATCHKATIVPDWFKEHYETFQ
ncbi:transposable element Tc1 transposase [Trichonephila clavipes]|uniref:Transposable element Tc1 transposase n=1 Tax=Trichonephila clavipes TaxID=2585209 RepID=A0A8X6W9T2_TRICX|nr:transposable element Tc1 transposase [Trichonephila clavipes]